MHMVERQAGDHGVRRRQRVQEAALLEGHAIRKRVQPQAGLAKHVGIDVENGHADAGKSMQDGGRERACAATEVQDVPVSWRECREQLDPSCDHVVVVRDETPDLNVVTLSVDIQMSLDRVHLTTGH